MKNFKLLMVALTLYSYNALANNLTISNLMRVLPTSSNTIKFDVSWDNSWDYSLNHDALWIYVKFRECGSSTWNHALLSQVMSDHILSANLSFAKPILSTDRWGNSGNFNNGCLIKRSNTGSGAISGTVNLKIVGSTSGVSFNESTLYDIQVFGIEMVQVPQGVASIGDGNQFTYSGTGSSSPKIISSESSTPIFTNNYYAWNTTIPASYPKGFNEFYCMKYEITQGQYVDFLNNIGSQASQRFYLTNYPAELTNAMNGITINSGQYITNGTVVGDTKDRACNFLSVNDVLAFLDWAALRPMTELEYEKACRGQGGTITDQYAWGSTTAVDCNAVSGSSSGVEVSTTPGSNCQINNEYTAGGSFAGLRYGPVAVGIFARSLPVATIPTRENTGATYWGIMEMTGNVTEMCARVSPPGTNATPSTYTGLWGDGMLSASGDANVTNWVPNFYCLRGGNWYTPSNGIMSVSNASPFILQNSAELNYRTINYGGNYQGGRGVR
jgi:formylglycine-generating enzyme required for sulfatase activity